MKPRGAAETPLSPNDACEGGAPKPLRGFSGGPPPNADMGAGATAPFFPSPLPPPFSAFETSQDKVSESEWMHKESSAVTFFFLFLASITSADSSRVAHACESVLHIINLDYA